MVKQSALTLFLVEADPVTLRAASRRVETLLANGIEAGDLIAVVVNKPGYVDSVAIKTIREQLPIERVHVISSGGEQLFLRSDALAPDQHGRGTMFAESVRQLAGGVVQRTRPARSQAEAAEATARL
jgi:hypothetical protein